MLAGLHDGVVARLRIVGFEDLRIEAAGRNRRGIAHQQYGGRISAPRQAIAVDAPVIGGLADGREDGSGVEGSVLMQGSTWLIGRAHAFALTGNAGSKTARAAGGAGFNHGSGKSLNDSVNAGARPFSGTSIAIS